MLKENSYLENMRRKYFIGVKGNTFVRAMRALLAAGVTIVVGLLITYGVLTVMRISGMPSNVSSDGFFEKTVADPVSGIVIMVITTMGLGGVYYKVCGKIVVQRDGTIFKEKFRIYHEYLQFITDIIKRGEVTLLEKTEIQRLLANITTIFNAENNENLEYILTETVQILADVGDVQYKNKNRQGISESDYFDKRNHLNRLLNIADIFRRDLHDISHQECQKLRVCEQFEQIQTVEMPVGQMVATPLSDYHMPCAGINKANIEALLFALPGIFRPKLRSYTTKYEGIIISAQTERSYFREKNSYQVEVSFIYSRRTGQYYYRWKFQNKQPDQLLKEAVQHGLTTLMCELRGSGNNNNEWTLNASGAIKQFLAANNHTAACTEIARMFRSICNLTDALIIQYHIRNVIAKSKANMELYWKSFMWDFNTVAYNSLSKPKDKTEYIDIVQLWPKRECRLVVGCRYHGDLPLLKARMKDVKGFSYVEGSRCFYSDESYRIGAQMDSVVISLTGITQALNAPPVCKAQNCALRR